jgi:hypothetical protein
MRSVRSGGRGLLRGVACSDLLPETSSLLDPHVLWARCAGDCRRICTGQAVCEQNPTLARAEIPTQHIFGVFLSRQKKRASS